jgi:drug/metabolite transporter (DMT)-like permease
MGRPRSHSWILVVAALAAIGFYFVNAGREHLGTTVWSVAAVLAAVSLLTRRSYKNGLVALVAAGVLWVVADNSLPAFLGKGDAATLLGGLIFLGVTGAGVAMIFGFLGGGKSRPEGGDDA